MENGKDGPLSLQSIYSKCSDSLTFNRVLISTHQVDNAIDFRGANGRISKGSCFSTKCL